MTTNLPQTFGNVKRMKNPASPPARPAVALDIAASVRNATDLANALHAAFPCLAGRLNSRVTVRSRNSVSVAVAADLDVDHEEICAFVAGYAQRGADAMVAMLVPVDQVARYQRNLNRASRGMHLGSRSSVAKAVQA